jgi:hypothetical protein
MTLCEPKWIIDERAPWTTVTVRPIDMPGMISDEELQYYGYIGKFYQGSGEIIELGPWLGKSTRHIIRGLKQNSNFINKKITRL